MKIRPLGKKILVQRAKHEEKKGVLIVPTPNEIKNEGTVLAIGDDVTQVKVGDYVLFPPYTGTPVKLEEEELHIMEDLLILDEIHVIGVIDENNT